MSKRGKILTAAAVLAAVLLLGGIGGFFLGRSAKLPVKSDTVLRCRDNGWTLDTTGYSYFAQSEYYYFRDVYTDYLAGKVDFSKPLSEQAYSEEQSWQDYLTERTLQSVRDTMAMVFEAEKNGYTLSESGQASFDATMQGFADAAKKQGYADLEAYLRASYGENATADSFTEYMKNTHLAADYAEHLRAQIVPTAEEKAAYLAAHEGDYADCADAEAEAEEDLIDETYHNLYLSAIDRYAFEADYNAIDSLQAVG